MGPGCYYTNNEFGTRAVWAELEVDTEDTEEYNMLCEDELHYKTRTIV
jgi:hypothetical protein